MTMRVGLGGVWVAVLLSSACGGNASENSPGATPAGGASNMAAGGALSAGSGGSAGSLGNAGGGSAGSGAAGGMGGDAGSSSAGGAHCTKTTCTVSSPTSTVSGTAPDGALSLGYAWKAQTSGFSSSTTLFLTNSSTASLMPCDEPSLSVALEVVVGAGAQTVVAVARNRDGSETGVPASISVETDDPQGATSGKIDITGSGWDLHGSFQAPDCPDLDFTDK